MGMLDSFWFEAGVLPNNKESPSTEFQTKSLECQLDNYHVNTTGRLYKSVLAVSDECLVSRTHPEPIEFTGEVNVYSIDVSAKDLPTREQHYTLVFKDGWLMKATKTYESGFAERDAALLQSFSPD